MWPDAHMSYALADLSPDCAHKQEFDEKPRLLMHKRADNVPREQALLREAHHDTRAPQRNTCSIKKAVVSRICSCAIRSRVLLPCQPVVKFRSKVEYKIANRMCPYCGHERHVA